MLLPLIRSQKLVRIIVCNMASVSSPSQVMEQAYNAMKLVRPGKFVNCAGSVDGRESCWKRLRFWRLDLHHSSATRHYGIPKGQRFVTGRFTKLGLPSEYFFFCRNWNILLEVCDAVGQGLTIWHYESCLNFGVVTSLKENIRIAAVVMY